MSQTQYWTPIQGQRWKPFDTPIGSVPTEAEKGCDLIPFMDLPPAVAVPKLMVTIWESLKRWHPRVLVDRVEVQPVDDDEHGFSRYRCPMFWKPVARVVQDLRQTYVDVSRERLGLSVLARVPFRLPR